MKKLVQKLLLVGVLFLVPLSILADDAKTTPTQEIESSLNVSFFTPASNDLSIKYLGQVFGTVGNVLHGTQGQLLGHMFSIVNSGLSAILIVLMLYSIFMVVMHTANEGEFSSRGKSTALIALRTAGGMALLIPGPTSGYSIAQVIVMWVVVQGVGLADKAWSRALDYLENEGGTIYISQPIASDNLRPLIAPVAEVLKSETCMYKMRELTSAVNEDVAQAKKNYGLDTAGSLTEKTKVGYSFNKDQTISFGTLNDKYDSADAASHQYNNECGMITWGVTQAKAKLPTMGIKLNISKPSAKDQRIGESNTTYREAAIKQVVIDLMPTAKKIALAENPTDSKLLNTEATTAILGAVADYANLISPMQQKEVRESKDELKEQLQTARKNGWLVAGSYYRHLGQFNQELNADLKSYIPVIDPTAPRNKSATEDSKRQGSGLQIMGDTLNQLTNSINSINGFAANAYKKIDELGQTDTTDSRGLSQSSIDYLGKTIIAAGGVITASTAYFGAYHLTGIVGSLTAAVSGLLYAWADTINKAGDPTIQLQQLGHYMIIIASTLWATISGIIYASILASAALIASGIPISLDASFKAFLPVIMSFMAITFSEGIIFSVYIPLVPFIIFTFAVLGWLIAVLEAIAAAPLVALGITHPEGHDLLGKADQALMLILKVFLYPILLIIGLLAAMIVSQVSVRILNAGFSTIVSGAKIGAGGDIFSTVGLIIAYTLILIYLYNMSYNIMPILVQKVMAWIGHHPESSNYNQELEGVKSGVSSGGKAMQEAKSHLPTELGKELDKRTQ